MSLNKPSKEINNIDVMDDLPELDEFQEKMEEQDSGVDKEQIARRRIEDLLEEKRLRQQIEDDFPEIDLE